ncbi:MAG: pyridoxal phosphate-dependent aminotransferase family protein [Candidatus Sumerlaeia bacterium]
MDDGHVNPHAAAAEAPLEKPCSETPSARGGRPSIFEKCRKFTAPEQARREGWYPYFRVISSAQDTWVTINGQKVLMMGSNSYMGLTNDERIKEAAIEATRKYGSGCAGSRFLNGTLDLHIELEERLARFVGKPAALCYTTGFQTNMGTIEALVGKNDWIVLDKSDHACIIDGARLSFGRIVKFNHNDLDHLEQFLKNAGEAGKMIAVDGVYSMEGDIAPLPEMVRLARRYDAAVFVDEAHSIGVLGDRGQGTAAHFGLTDEVDLITGTFSKSLASIGGFVAGDYDVIDYLRHHSRALIFSASMAPPCAAAALKALDIIESEPWRRENLWNNARYLKKGCEELGYDTWNSCTPIIPLIIGDDMTVYMMRQRLHEEGVFVNPCVSPAVPPGRALIRLSVMATHTFDQIDFALDKLKKVGKELGVI